MRERVYIAGPVTGVDGFGENFKRAARLLLEEGYTPIDPTAPGLVDGWEYRDYINRGFALLMDCDAICTLPGYEKSPGAMLEVHYAMAVGMRLLSIQAIHPEG